VMETWNQVERQIRAGSGLTLKPTEEARKLIEQGGIDTLLRQCRPPHGWTPRHMVLFLDIRTVYSPGS
jgi:hypothetical protein